MLITKKFTSDKTTTNKYRFQELSDKDGRQLTQGEADIGTIYVPKRLFSGPPPAIWVTVTDVNPDTE